MDVGSIRVRGCRGHRDVVGGPKVVVGVGDCSCSLCAVVSVFFDLCEARFCGYEFVLVGCELCQHEKMET